MIRSDIRTYLLAQAGLMTHLDRDGKQHVYLSRVPQSSPAYANFPCVVYRRQNGGHGHEIDGSDGTASPIFEFIVIADDPDKVEAIGEEVRQAMQGFRGEMGDTQIDECLLADEYDGYLESRTGDDVGFYTTTFEYKIGYQESIPTFA